MCVLSGIGFCCGAFTVCVVYVTYVTVLFPNVFGDGVVGYMYAGAMTVL
jgi:hypothetical protein